MKPIQSLLLLASFSLSFQAFASELWRGLVVKQENRCAAYDKKKDYPYSQSVEDLIVERMGGKVYGPYTGRYFKSDTSTDIEHIVSASEGHDSGLCAASAAKKAAFASDQLNLTLAAPKVNRCSTGGKCGYDASEWMPEKNKCWFANRIVEIKTKYTLSVDRAETNALDAVLSKCDSTEMIFYAKDNGPMTVSSNTPASVASTPTTKDALKLFDDNNNGRITCAEARSHGIAPVYKKHPAYPFMRDSDGDGVVCE
ncbi:hypothetical protein FM109_00460 [Vibrio casei]|uniref:Excalibur calcium-binding domain-containing protein n=2 Tax=Gammaproteobacteria TaxID=1236 RepID=A0A368LFT9_9VIBR|nr:excalibur calcium-binding domain-containing protein [Vibrio casei]RCS68330.1 hypothetical protein CIK83_18195 [Vibrio casei]RCS68645.1 hypothetical protein CIK83_17155 [Vibrio casei]SJN16151.1 hypothetical protein FM109_00460 [Vibrio casei]